MDTWSASCGESVMRPFVSAGPRHLLSAAELGPDDIERCCLLADAFERGEGPTERHGGRMVALLFFQASTRTRVGFHSAAVGLGAVAIGMDDMNASRSNARTGETLEDCAAVFSRLCDAIVVRHFEAGAAHRMAAQSLVPVINAGDGFNAHPSQALIDIFALRRGLGDLRGRTLGLVGDPRGRTVRSLIQLLRHERPAELLFCPPAHTPVPDDLLAALRLHPVRIRYCQDVRDALLSCDAVMMSPYDVSDIGEAPSSGYVSARATPDSHRVTAEKLTGLGSRTLLYHPLPRLDELSPCCDALPNARYFEQVRLSRFMRMAILHQVLGGR